MAIGAIMKVTVQFFARARDLAGTDSTTIELPDGSTVANLRSDLEANFEDLKPLLPHVLIAMNTEYVRNETSIQDGAEIAIIPPVSGG